MTTHRIKPTGKTPTMLTIITTRRDIDTYAHSCTADATVAERFAELIAEADHPLYGSDWSDWLADNADAIYEQACA